MNTPDTNVATAMVNIFDANGSRVTGDLEPGEYKLVLETANLLAAVGPQALVKLVMSLKIDANELVTAYNDAQLPREGTQNLELPFSVDKWMKQVYAIALLYVGDENFQGHLFWMDELHQKVTSHFP